MCAVNSINVAKWYSAKWNSAPNPAETQQLLSLLGTVRHIVGAKTEAGQKAANQMNSLRQKLKKYRVQDAIARDAKRQIVLQVPTDAADAPF